jgi:hypothetical protein
MYAFRPVKGVDHSKPLPQPRNFKTISIQWLQFDKLAGRFNARDFMDA